jgi:prophage regulatory protein
MLRVIVSKDLKPKKGIPYCSDHIRRLEKKGEFPLHINLGDGRIAWIEAEIDNWIEQKIRKRDNYLPSQQSLDATTSPQIADYITAPDYDKPQSRRKRGRPPKAVSAPERQEGAG